MEIKSISQKIFKTSPSKIETNSNHTNPFGVNFKGNMISADVFESNEKSKVSFTGNNLIQNAAKKGRMWTSAIVGSMNNVNQAISSRLNRIVDCGRKMTDGVKKAWNYLNTTNLQITLDANLVERTSKALARITSDSAYSSKRLAGCSVDELRGMFGELATVRVLA